jgi:hypothetical protein
MNTRSPRSTDELIRRFAGTRDHVVSREELVGIGVAEQAIDRRIGGMLIRRHPGVYAVDRPDVAPRGRIRGALLAAGPEAAASHDSGAFVRGLLDDVRGAPHVTTTRRTGHSIAGVVTHRVRTAPEIEILDGLPVTTVERTLLDLAAIRHPRLQRALNEALYRRLTDRERLAEAAASPRRGCRLLREAIARGARTRSVLEDDFFAMLHEAALPLPIANASVGLYEVDFLWPEHGVVVETDGCRRRGSVG